MARVFLCNRKGIPIMLTYQIHVEIKDDDTFKSMTFNLVASNEDAALDLAHAVMLRLDVSDYVLSCQFEL